MFVLVRIKVCIGLSNIDCDIVIENLHQLSIYLSSNVLDARNTFVSAARKATIGLQIAGRLLSGERSISPKIRKP
jgi:hypothetical protein